jgi:DNA-binding CsgD family transcriptional regulator
MPCGVIVLDAQGFVVLSNPAIVRMCGVGIEANRPWSDQLTGYLTFDPAIRRKLPVQEHPSARVLSGEVVQDTEVLIRHPGREADYWLRVDGVPLRSPSGRVAGAVLAYTDVSRERTLARDLAATALEHARLLGRLAEHKARLERLAEPLADPSGPAPQPSPGADGLTQRDRDILRLLAQGMTNREIGSALHLSPGTVRNRVGRLLARLGATDRTQAAVLAVTRGLLEAE